MGDLTTNEATALMAAGMYVSPPTEAQFQAGIERAESWLAAHDAQVEVEAKAEALREASAQCSNVAFGSNADVAEWLTSHAATIESQETP